MNPNKVLWEKGDFTKIAETLRGSGSAPKAFDVVREMVRVTRPGRSFRTADYPPFPVDCSFWLVPARIVYYFG